MTSPSSLFRWWLAILMGSLLVVVVLRQWNGPAAGDANPAVGKAAPQVDLVRLTESLSLESVSQLPRDRVTLLHFWGTWCGPCRMEYPHLAEMTGQFAGRREFQFVPVTCESGGGETFQGLWDKTDKYFRENQIESEAFADPRGITRRSVADRLGRGNLYYPTSILIDREGKIAGVWEGYTPNAVAEIAEITDSLLAAGAR